MDLDFASQANELTALADALLPFFEGPLGDLIREEIGDGSTEVLEMDQAAQDLALTFLIKPQAEQAAIGQIETPATALLVLRARYVALKVAHALEFAEQCKAFGNHDARAVVCVAAELLRAKPFKPTVAEILDYTVIPNIRAMMAEHQKARLGE